MNFLCEEGKNKEQPVRQCAFTRERRPEDKLLRFVLDPDNRVVPDIARRLPGRGVWITGNKDIIARAVRQKAFARGFRQSVTVDPELTELVDILLRRAALQNLALANKSGAVVAGFAKVEGALKGRRALTLVHASDAAHDGSGKLDRTAKAMSSPERGEQPTICCFSSAELSAALGRSNVNHAAVADEGGGRTFLRAARRYIGYMGPHPATVPMADMPEQE